MSPCNLRLSPQEAVELEFSIAERVDEYMKFYEPRKSVHTSRVFSCGAGSRVDAWSAR